VAHFHWLVAQGVPFKHSFYAAEPSMEAPGDDCLVYCGGEDTHPFDRIARPAPRGHKPQHPGAAGGFLMQCLLDAVARSGARVECDARADALVLDAGDRVAGVVAARAGRRLAVRARRGVVLTAGGFVLEPGMVQRHCPAAASCSWLLSAGHDDGSGIRMGQAAGGAVIHMDALECAIPLTPPRRLVRGVIVNRAGQRFINEDAYYGRIGQAALLRQGGEFYFVHDEATYAVNDNGMQAKWVADSIEELEREMDCPMDRCARRWSCTTATPRAARTRSTARAALSCSRCARRRSERSTAVPRRAPMPRSRWAGSTRAPAVRSSRPTAIRFPVCTRRDAPRRASAPAVTAAGSRWPTGRTSGAWRAAPRPEAEETGVDPRKLADIEAIKQLKARYFRYMDTRQWQLWSGVFTVDCHLRVEHEPGVIGTDVRGRDAIVRGVREALEGTRTVHHGHMPEIEITGPTTARGVWAMFDSVRWGDERDLEGYGHYHETYRKSPRGRWQIASLLLTRLRVDHPGRG
jgi:hypothetical protein